MTTTIKVIDSIMGAGKTSWAIQEMQSRPLDKWLYVTPFVSEIERILTTCPGFVQPVPKKDPDDPDSTPKKLNHLKQLMAEGANIASSHALFEDIDADVLKLASDMMKVLLIGLVLLVQGCFIDDLCGTKGENEERIYRAPEPNPPVVVIRGAVDADSLAAP